MTGAEEHDPEWGHRIHAMVIGPEGLRAGWGCLLFLFLTGLIGYAASFLIRFLAHPRARPHGAALGPAQIFPVELGLAALVLLVTFIMSRIERRPLSAYGLGFSRFAPRFAGGLLAGFAALSALIGLLGVSRLLALDSAGLHDSAVFRYGVAWGACFLLTGMFEELLLRGYLLFTLARGIGFWWGALLLSAAFGLIHGNNPGETSVGLFSAAAVGLVFCLSIWYTRTLTWAIAFHAAWDWGESFFWGTADSGLQVKGHLFSARPLGRKLWSGGLTGPEGSLLVFPVLLLCALFICLWWGRRGAMRESPRHASV